MDDLATDDSYDVPAPPVAPEPLRRFVEQAPTPTMGVVAFAEALMVDEPEHFKRGYTAPNAFLAAMDMARRSRLDVDPAVVAAYLGVDPSKAVRDADDLPF